MYQKVRVHGVHPNGRVDPSIVAQDQEYFLQKGWIQQKVDAAKLVDMQYIDYALKRLGEYEE